MSNRVLWSLFATAVSCLSCRPAHPPPPTPEAWKVSAPSGSVVGREAGATPWCGAAIRLRKALPDPTAVADREGEWLQLRNDEPIATHLDGWLVDTGTRQAELTDLVIGPGASLCIGGNQSQHPLGSLRLRNGAGRVALIDPCGVQWSELRWGPPVTHRLRGDEVTSAPTPWDRDENGPTRKSSGAIGGCGQI